jgi:lysine N6-hydroxylase
MIYDLIGVGIGPSNLSLASLLHKYEDFNYKFLESKSEFSWHKGLIFRESNLKVTILKDLVILADPTNPFSFLSFLHDTGRIYRYLNSKFETARLKEFEQYLKWVAQKNKNCYYNSKVREISFNNGCFNVKYNDQEEFTKNLVIGIGNKPFVPGCCKKFLGNKVFHGINYLNKQVKTKDARIAIIGGGQSGAEIFSHILGKENEGPSKIHWISKRENLLPMDDSSFANEWYMPSYVKNFYDLDHKTKVDLLKKQKLSSDGIHFNLLKKIYQRIYELEFLMGVPPFWNLAMSHEMVNINMNSDKSYQITVKNNLNKTSRQIDVDYVILCTGFQNHVPDFVSGLDHRIQLEDKKFVVNEDFSVEWDGPQANKIYVQNNAINFMGISDPNLSLMAWRSSVIANSLLEKEVYKTNFDKSIINWG